MTTNQPLTRWQAFYSEDPNLGTIPASLRARQAAEIFAKNHKHFILDVGCGTGRDTICLAEKRNFVVGIDAAYAGLVLAKQRQPSICATPHYAASLAQFLPFPSTLFDGVYCFGLLHEFVGISSNANVTQVMSEIYRVLKPSGLVILTVLAGDPDEGLPHVQCFSEKMFDDVTFPFQCLEKNVYEDVSCTGKVGYRLWYGQFTKPA